MEKDKNFVAKVVMDKEAALVGFSMVSRDVLIIPVLNQKKRMVQEAFGDKTKHGPRCRKKVSMHPMGDSVAKTAESMAAFLEWSKQHKLAEAEKKEQAWLELAEQWQEDLALHHAELDLCHAELELAKANTAHQFRLLEQQLNNKKEGKLKKMHFVSNSL